MRGIRYRKRFALEKITHLLFIVIFVSKYFPSVSGHKITKEDASQDDLLPVEKGRTTSEFLNAASLALKEDKKLGDKPEDKTFFGEDSDGNPIVVGSWFQYGSYTLATAMWGTGFLVACAATAVYYVLFVVTDPRQTGLTRRRRRRRNTRLNSAGSSTSAAENIGKLFTTLDIALELYNGFEWSNPDCRRKLWCATGESSRIRNNRIGRTLSWIKNNLNPDQRKDTDATPNCSEITTTPSKSSCPFPFQEFENKLKSLFD